MDKFGEIKNYMETIAREKVRYHDMLKASVLVKYRDPRHAKKLISLRL